MKRISMAKALFTSAMVCGMTLGTSAQVVAYWPFGTNGVNDVSGNNHTLTSSGVVFTNGAALFSGSQTACKTTNKLNLSSYSGVTVECFIRGISTGPRCVLEHSASRSNTGAINLTANDSSRAGSMRGKFKTTDGWNMKDTAVNAVTNGYWSHIAFVIDSTQMGVDRAKLYLDGVLQPTTTANYSNDAATVFRDDILYIGAQDAYTGNKLSGELDDVRITARALAPNEFLQARSVDVPLTLAYWPFDLANNALADASGNGNALAHSGVVFSNGVASFNGSHKSFNTLNTLNLRYCPAVTMECFFRSTDSSANGRQVLEHSPTRTNFGSLGIIVNEFGLPGIVVGKFKTSDGANGWNMKQTASGAVSDQKWHHVAYVVDSSQTETNRSQLYLDRVLQPTTSSVYTNDGVTAFRNDLFYIGSRSANTDAKFKGEIDDVRVTAGVLSTNDFLQAPTTNTVFQYGVVAYWPFDAGRQLVDASGNGHSLTNSGITFEEGAAKFSGSHKVFSTVGTLDLSRYQALTIEYYIRSSAASTCFMLEHPANYANYPGGFGSYFKLETNGDFWLLGGFKTTSSYNIEKTDVGAASDGRWHHVALVIDSFKLGADRAQLYLDRARQTTYPASADDSAASFRNEILHIGSRAGTLCMTGLLDDVRITGRTLTVEEFMAKRTSAKGTLITLQ